MVIHMKYIIRCFAHSRLYDRIRDVIDAIDDTELDLKLIDCRFDEGTEKIDREIDLGMEVAIAGGAVSRVIKENYSVPLVDLTPSGMDYMSLLVPVAKKHHHIALVYYKKKPDLDYSYYCQQMNVTTESIVYQNVQELYEKVCNSNATLIVGPSTAVEQAERCGKESLLLYPTDDTILQKIFQGKEIAKGVRDKRNRLKFTDTILKHFPAGILGIDAEGYITECNEDAGQIVGFKSGNLIGQRAAEVCPWFDFEQATAQQETTNILVKISQKRTYIRYVNFQYNQINLGAVMLLQTADDIKQAEQDYETRKWKKRIQSGFYAQYSFQNVVGDSAAIREVIESSREFARTNSNVMIVGETGTGKELIAQSIHNASLRSGGPFVAINCAALPENIIESELFGYEEGAFTGSRKGGKTGLIELSDHGTLFLDEVGELSKSLQVKLLRVIQEKEFIRIGGTQKISVDLRTISATNKAVLSSSSDNPMRLDLLYRLNVLSVQVPPLRERDHDVVQLFNRFLKNQEPVSLAQQDEEVLLTYSWPGNIRELQNVAERFSIYYANDRLRRTLTSREILIRSIGKDILFQDIMDSYGYHGPKSITGDLITKLISIFPYSREKIADRLEISRSTMWRLLKNTEPV